MAHAANISALTDQLIAAVTKDSNKKALPSGNFPMLPGLSG